MLLAVFFIWKQPKCLSAAECVDKLWCIHAMDYYLNKTGIHGKAWVNLKMILLHKKKKPSSRDHILHDLIYRILRKSKVFEDSKSVAARRRKIRDVHKRS